MTHRFGRRRFLIGAGGTSLALPLLPSLFGSDAEAQLAGTRPRFVVWSMEHGAVSSANMYPSDSVLTETTALAAGHVARHGQLVATPVGANSALSPTLTAASNRLTDRLVAKLNVLRGFDILCVPGHHDGFLGNFALNDDVRGSGLDPASFGGYRASIDQVMAESSSVYQPGETILERSIHTGYSHRGGASWGHRTAGDTSSQLYSLPAEPDPAKLFDRIFRSQASEPSTPSTPSDFVVDRVIENYRRLRDSSRISAADRVRLTEHLDRLYQLEASINNVRAVSCEDAARPTSRERPEYKGASEAREYYGLVNDVIVTAFHCGTTRICEHRLNQNWSDYAGNWHHDVAHLWFNSDPQEELRAAQQRFFEHAFLDLASKLDAAEEFDGKTYLDNCLLMWTQEAGHNTHEALSVPIILAGSAAGFFKTGHYVDYRNRDQTGVQLQDAPEARPGILYNQMLANALMAMGVPPSEFEYPGERGYGYPGFGPNRNRWVRGNLNQEDIWPESVRATASDPLPVIT